MKTTDVTREEMWGRQQLSAGEVDYVVWGRDKAVLREMSRFSHSCSFVVDVYKCRYAFASQELGLSG